MQRYQILPSIFWTCIVCVHLSTVVKAGNYSDYSRLYHHLTTSYDINTRPVVNQSLPLAMNLAANINYILDIDEVAQTLEFSAWFNITWYDELRIWNTSAEFGDIEFVQIKPTDTWLPVVQVSDSVEERSVFKDDLGTIFIQSNGFTAWQVGSDGFYIFSI